MIVVHTLMGLQGARCPDGRDAVVGGAARPPGQVPVARHVRLYPSLDKADRIYVSFDERLMAYRLADGQALWTKPATRERPHPGHRAASRRNHHAA